MPDMEPPRSLSGKQAHQGGTTVEFTYKVIFKPFRLFHFLGFFLFESPAGIKMPNPTPALIMAHASKINKAVLITKPDLVEDKVFPVHN
jgi:hypothetical protein